MKLEELKNYYLHDSSILEMKKIDNSINLKIEYCLFMQDDYVEGTDETCILNLKFNDATIELAAAFGRINLASSAGISASVISV